MTQLSVLRTVSSGTLLFLVGRWVAPSGRALVLSVFTVLVMNICDLTDNRSQKAVTSVLHKPADTCHSSVKFGFVYGSPLFLFCLWNIYEPRGCGGGGCSPVVHTSQNELKRFCRCDNIIFLHD